MAKRLLSLSFMLFLSVKAFGIQPPFDVGQVKPEPGMPHIQNNFEDIYNRLTIFQGAFTINTSRTPYFVENIIARGPWVDVRSYASINAAVLGIGSAEATLLIPDNQTLTASLTIPSNITLMVMDSGVITKASSFSLTINGPLVASRTKIFNGFTSGDITFGTAATDEVYPEWWGAVGDDSTDDYAAIQYCIDASTGSTFRPKISFGLKKYKIGTGLNIGFAQGVKMVGQAGGSHIAGGVGYTNKVTTIRFTGSTSAITIGNGSNSATGFIMENIFWNGTGGSGDGITLDLAAGSSFRDLTIANFDASGKAGIKVTGTQVSSFDNIGFNTNYYGLWSVGSSTENTTLHLNNCTFNTNTRYGYYDTGSSLNSLENCVFQDTAGSAIFVDATGFSHAAMSIINPYVAGSNTSVAGHAIDILGDATNKSWNFMLLGGYFATPGASQTAHVRLRYTRQAVMISPRVSQLASPNFIIDPTTNLEFSFYGWNTALNDIEDGASVAVPWPRLGVEQPYFLTSLSNFRVKKDLDVTQTVTASSATINVVSASSGSFTSAFSAKGTVTNNDAPAGYIGEFKSTSTASVTSFPTSGQFGNNISLDLTPGDWDMTLNLCAELNGATMTPGVNMGISTTSGNSASGLTLGSNYSVFLPPTTVAGDACGAIPFHRASIGSTTTYYAKIAGTYSIATPRYLATMTARRVR